MTIEVSMIDADLEMMTKEFNIIHALPLINVLQVVGERSEQAGYDELRRDVKKNGFIDNSPFELISSPKFPNYRKL